MQRAGGILSRMSIASNRALAGGFCSFMLVLLAARAARAGDMEPKRIFGQRCSSCHTFGHGVKVGPDLKGVTSRRERPWLLRFIRSSQTLIQSRDSVAAALFDQFRGQRMPDWTDLSEGQIGAVLDWLSVGGPDQKEADERDAALATAADVERARALFDGSAPLANGGAACATCHTIRDEGRTIGASLGPDLTFAYLKYRDRGLTLFLRQPCFRREPESSSARFLVPDEIFELKAYLRRAALPPGVDATPSATAPDRTPPPPRPASPSEAPPDPPAPTTGPLPKGPAISNVARPRPRRGRR